MNFSCSACQAKYFVRDEDVVGRTLKLICRRCHGTIPIQGRRRSDPVEPPRSISSDRLRLALPLELTGARAVAGLVEAAPSSVRPSLPPSSLSEVGPGEFYVGIAGVPVGPLVVSQVAMRVAAGEIGARTYVWHAGLTAWMRLAEVPALADLVTATPSLGPPQSLAGSAPSVAPASAGARTLEERLGFGYLGDAPPSSQPRTPRGEQRVRLAPGPRPVGPHRGLASLLVGLVISLAVGVTLGALL